ncbi:MULTISPECIES: spherulation-specific family 4 protein [unclassified Streptomyces]|uniref:spherulation-specific family 4 protein n=1 Tax=unclassified Streptomyces TaxID=2593676 RepID=UPI003418FFBB
MRLLIPLYVHPSQDPGAWALPAAESHSVHGVVLNPANGPGSARDPAFTAVSRALRAAGVRVLGYVDTGYGERPAREVANDFARHREWYETDGCFLDQVTPERDGLPACRRLVGELRRIGAGTVVLNSGVYPAPGYARLADLIVVFEGHWSTYARAFSRPKWTARYPPERFCHLVYGVPPALVPLAVRTARQRHAAVCGPVTGELPNPWAGLTPALTGEEHDL